MSMSNLCKEYYYSLKLFFNSNVNILHSVTVDWDLKKKKKKEHASRSDSVSK